MKSRTLIMRGLCLSLAPILMGGCSKDDNPAAPQVTTPAGIQQVVLQAGKAEPLGPDRNVVVSMQVAGEGDVRTVTETRDVARNIEEIACPGLDGDVVWPGNLLKGAAVHQFAFDRVTGVAREPIYVAMWLENCTNAPELVWPIVEPDRTSVAEGVHHLLATAREAGATCTPSLQFENTQVFSASHANLVIGADLECGAARQNTAFDWVSITKRNKFVVKFRQLLYTVEMQMPHSPDALFACSNTVECIRSAIPSGSCPLFVSEVGYGMMALAFIESDYTAGEMKFALEAAFAGRPMEQEIRPGVPLSLVLRGSSIRTAVYGGEGAGLGSIETGYTGFMKVLGARAKLEAAAPAAPVLWKLRHLRDNEPAKITMTSRYSVTRTFIRGGPGSRYPS